MTHRPVPPPPSEPTEPATPFPPPGYPGTGYSGTAQPNYPSTGQRDYPPAPKPNPAYPSHPVHHPPQPQPPSGYAPGTHYAAGWTQEQMAQFAGPTPRAKSRPSAVWLAVLVVVLVAAAGALWLAVSPSARLALTGSTTPLPADVETAHSANMRQLSVGNCLNDSADLRTKVSGIAVVPCSDPHTAQVISAYEFRSDEWDGTEATGDLVVKSCSLSASEITAGYTLLALTPSEASWKQGDRTGLCVAIAAEAVSGSLT